MQRLARLKLKANGASGSSCAGLTRVSDDDVFEEVRVRHGPLVPVRTAVSTVTPRVSGA